MAWQTVGKVKRYCVVTQLELTFAGLNFQVRFMLI